MDFNHNEIQHIFGLENLSQLELLDISHNDIINFDDVKSLTKNQSLYDLKVIFNPFSETKESYQ